MQYTFYYIMYSMQLRASGDNATKFYVQKKKNSELDDCILLLLTIGMLVF